MDTYTLELRQKEAQVVSKNGDYEVIVKEKILMEEGDSVVIKSVYIDTEASSNQKINVPTDLTLTMDYLKWWRYYFKKGAGNIVAQGSTGFNVAENGQLYIVSDGHNLAVAPQLIGFTDDLVFQTSDDGGKLPCGDFDLTIEYKDFNDELQRLKIHVPQIKNAGFFGAVNVRLPKPLIWRTDGFSGQGTLGGLNLSPTTDQMASIHNTKLDLTFSEGTGAEVFVEPRNHTAEVKVEAGSYSPVDLCNVINKQLTLFKSKSGSDPLYGNVILQPETNYFASVSANEIGVDVGDVPNVLSIESGSDPQLVGTNQAELTYIDSIQKFAWNQLHQPILDDKGVPSISYDGATGAVQSAYSGISFTFLGAVRDDNGQEFDFWSGLLGFDLPVLYPQFEFKEYENITWRGGIGTNMLMCNFTQFEAGVNFTEGLVSVAPLVASSQATLTATGGQAFPITTTITNPTNGKNVVIEASNSVLGATSSFGYFLIEVNAKFGGKFVMKDQMKNNIRAIVGRFYEINSYTSGSEGDSLLYTHKGSPVFLESFKCRILDSDKNLAPNLGDDNTIFLQVVKAPKTTPQDTKK